MDTSERYKNGSVFSCDPEDGANLNSTTTVGVGLTNASASYACMESSFNRSVEKSVEMPFLTTVELKSLLGELDNGRGGTIKNYSYAGS